MKVQLNQFNVNCPGIHSISSFGGNSLPICLTIGLIETCAIHAKSSLEQHTKFIKGKFDEIVNLSQMYLPEYSQHLKYLSDIFNFIIEQQTPKKALDELETLINSPEKLEAIYIASKVLIGGMMINKLRAAGEQGKLEFFLADEDYKDMSANILIFFCNYFLVNIKEYEETKNDEGLAKPDKAGIFPVIHLFKHNFKYYLAKTNEMDQLKTNQIHSLSLIEDMPFIYGKAKKMCPIGTPKKIQVIDYGDDVTVLKMIIEKMSLELKSKGGFSNELSVFISECQSHNNSVRSLACLAEIPMNCSLCRKVLDFNNFSETTHKNCGICDTCMAKGNGTCPKCRNLLSDYDKGLLGI